jgi:hypothetical protein
MDDRREDLPASSSTEAMHGAGGAGDRGLERAVIGTRPATAGDLLEYYGQTFPFSVRALVITIDDRVRGVLGLARRGDHYLLFSDTREELRPYLGRMPILRAIRRVMGWMEERGAPVLAVRSETEPRSAGLLERMGFEPYMQTSAGEVYRWQA